MAGWGHGSRAWGATGPCSVLPEASASGEMLASFLRGRRTTASTALDRLPCHSPDIPPLHPSLSPRFLYCVCSVMSSSAVPRTIACQTPLSVEFSRPAYWSGLPFLPPGNLPHPGIEPRSPASPALAGSSLPLCHLPSLPDFKPFLPLGHQNLQPLHHQVLSLVVFSSFSLPRSFPALLIPSSGIFQWVGGVFSFCQIMPLSFFCQISSFLGQTTFQSIYLRSKLPSVTLSGNRA